MSLLIEGTRIDALVERYCALTGQSDKGEAVCQALIAQIAVLSDQGARAEKIQDIQKRAAEAGFVGTGDSDKRFMDQQWGED